MQTYIVRVYRAHPGTTGSISGTVEAIESGQQAAFHNFDEFQTILGDSIAKGQLGFPDLTPKEVDTHAKLAAT